MNESRGTILVLEDEELLLLAVTKKLELNGFSVVSCTMGKQAIDYLEHLPELPDVIWLDYYLKDMNGLEFMHVLRSDPRWKNIPVVVVSNSANPEKVHSMLALGISKYVLKAEYRLEEIIKIMHDFVREEKQQ